jgi:histidinol dehydrogenase
MRIITAQAFQTETQAAGSFEQNAAIDRKVMDIITDVRKNGDTALFKYTAEFDKADLDQLLVTEAEFAEAETLVSTEFLAAINKAKENITRFHKAQKETSWFLNDENGVLLGQKVTPIEKVGVYIPGGKAAYPSTVMMNVIPAKIAGVESISIVTPPGPDGKVNPYVLAASKIAGADLVYKVGGAQAIAALAAGTETIEKVSKIVGPGNAYVASAKKLVFGEVSIDMIAGPSEICIVADETANAKFVAADLLSQAEHDEQATSICITADRKIAEAVQQEVKRQTASLERRTIIETSLEQNGRIILTETLEEAFALVNTIAPEHLQLMISNPTEKLGMVKNAGAIFLGNYAPEPLGDYFAGPNHTLPTSGTAVFSSPLGVYDFMKKSSIIHYSETALMEASQHIINLANVEGLTAHANAISIRKDE